jgi:glucuronate isomerase
MIGADVEAGLIPDDRAELGRLVENICYGNAADFFGLEVAQG